MFSYRLVWNDAAKRRDIQLRIDYRLEGEAVEVLDVVPTAVFLYEVDGEAVFKQLPVHTPTGRKVLRQAFVAGRGGAVSLEEEILAWHARSDDPLADSVVA